MEMLQEGCAFLRGISLSAILSSLSFMLLLYKKIPGSLSIGKVLIVGSHSREIKCLVPSLMCRLSKEGLIL